MARDRELQTLYMLILKSQNEPLSEAEIGELNELVATESGARDAAELLDQLAALSDTGQSKGLPINANVSSMKASDRDSVADPSSMNGAVRSASSWYWSSSAVWLIALASSYLLVATLAWSIARSLFDRDAFQADVTASPQLVAMTACVWESSSQSVPRLNSPIRSGEVLDLVEGIAELRVGEGTVGDAMVRIEGPASVFIRSDGKLGLHHGALTAKSLGIGRGALLIDAPIGDITLEGQSSVGLFSQGAVHELHVFSGRASLVQSRTGHNVSEMRLEEGDAVRVASSGDGGLELVKFEASLAHFASARSSGFDPLKIGPKYRDAVLQSRPSIYWRFEALDGSRVQAVKNEGSAANMDAIAIGELSWRQYGENRVVELGQSATSSAFRSESLWPPRPLDEYTIEMWLKPQLFHHGEFFCMHERDQQDDGRYSHSLICETIAQHWKNDLETLPPNRIRFVHRTPASGVVLEGSTLVSGEPYQARVWQHVVAQKSGDQLMLWLDGHLSCQLRSSDPLVANAQLLIGQLYISKNQRRFVGQIDEVAIYDRCLSREEIRGHIEASGRKVAPWGDE
jgi:hypothetical protein